MNRPYIICHMVMSIDGKVTGNYLYTPECEAAAEHYYEINRELHADAYACGRITMEGSFTGGWQPDLTPYQNIPMERTDYIADTETGFYAVAFDRRGKLGWKSPKIVDEDPGYGGAHIIEVLCENVSDAYLAYLQHIGVSYLFAGETALNIPLALEKLKTQFGIQTLLLEGGSILNGAFLKESLVDQLSLVLVPIVAETGDKPLFYESALTGYELTKASPLEKGCLWLQYKSAI